MIGYYWKLKVKTGKKYDPGQPRVPAGDPRGGQWTSSDGSSILPQGAVSATEIMPDAPGVLGEILDESYYVPTQLGFGAAGNIGRHDGEGNIIIPVAAGRRPSRAILVHEAVHEHQSRLAREDFILYSDLEKELRQAAIDDNASVGNPLWAQDYLDDPGEMWAAAAGFLYGGSASMMEQSSPRVTAVLRRLYERS